MHAWTSTPYVSHATAVKARRHPRQGRTWHCVSPASPTLFTTPCYPPMLLVKVPQPSHLAPASTDVKRPICLCHSHLMLPALQLRGLLEGAQSRRQNGEVTGHVHGALRAHWRWQQSYRGMPACQFPGSQHGQPQSQCGLQRSAAFNCVDATCFESETLPLLVHMACPQVVFSDHGCRGTTAKDRAVLEAAVAVSLSHPNIVRVFCLALFLFFPHLFLFLMCPCARQAEQR